VGGRAHGGGRDACGRAAWPTRRAREGGGPSLLAPRGARPRWATAARRPRARAAVVADVTLSSCRSLSVDDCLDCRSRDILGLAQIAWLFLSKTL